MPRLTDQTPKYRQHRASGRAIVTLNGKDIYLGPWNSRSSKIEYDRVISEWLAGGRVPLKAIGLTLAELLAHYKTYCEKTYVDVDGTVSKAATNIRLACKPLRQLYGPTPAAEFGPLKLKALVNQYVRMGWCRTHINRSVGLVKGFFKWAVSNEYIPADVYHGLQAVGGLRRGRTEARESDAIRPVAEEHARAIFPFVSRQVRAMIELQLLTGMRPGEVCIMRPCDLDTTDAVWIYTPSRHKTQNHGISRTVHLGPQAQAVLAPYFRSNLAEHFFSPADAEVERRARLHEQRKTPLSCGNKPGTNKHRWPQHHPGNHYKASAYLRAIYAACHRAYPYPADLCAAETDSVQQSQAKELKRSQWRHQHFWSPNQLRHTAATRIRKEFGAEAAQTILGHTQLKTTEIYAERNAEAAGRIMAKIG